MAVLEVMSARRRRFTPLDTQTKIIYGLWLMMGVRVISMIHRVHASGLSDVWSSAFLVQFAINIGVLVYAYRLPRREF